MAEKKRMDELANTLSNILGPVAMNALSVLGPIGAIPNIPVAGVLAYKQHRQIRMLEKAIDEIKSRPALVDDVNCNPEKYKKILEYIFDYCLQEGQVFFCL